MSLAQFEGVIEMKISDSTDSSPKVTFYELSVKGNLVSAETHYPGGTAGEGRFIFRGDRKVLWIVSDSEKSYLEISLHDTLTAKNGLPNISRQPNALTVTGKTGMIQGYPCEEFVAEESGRTIHIWGTPKLGNITEGLRKAFGEMEAKTAEDASGWEDELARRRIFPMKVVTMHGDVVEQTQEVTRIDKRKIPASTFEPPEGYEKHSFDLDVQKMLRQLQEQSQGDSTKE